jgi:DNA-binding NarL/FixJ family response regulator
MKSAVHILLADDHLLLRKGLRLLIESEEGLRVIGEADDGRAAIEQVRELAPDIVVMDINMPNLNGADATRQICAESPQTKILALSIHSGRQYVESMLAAGADGYLLKQCAPAELIRAIKVISEGGAYLSPDISGVVLSRLREGMNAGEPLPAEDHPPAPKRQRPGLDAGIVHRPQLIQKLRTWPEKRLTLVAAPDGYGKTTLVSDWLAQGDSPSAWLTPDRDDNELTRFLESLLVSIRTLFPGACPNLQSLVEAANRPPVSTLADALINDLQQCPQRFLLAIDDFQLIDDKSVNDLLSRLLKQPSHRMHLVLMTCRHPFLPLSFLRANNAINELRAADLGFTLQETTTFLERALDREIDPETASAWRERTEGRVAGLQLVRTTDKPPDAKAPDANDSDTPEASRRGSETPEGLRDWRGLLTNREYEVLLLLQQRLSDQEIADKMHISLATARSHTKNIREKLGVTSRRAAVSKAISLNFLPAE